MATLQTRGHCLRLHSPKLLSFRSLKSFSFPKDLSFPWKIRVLRSDYRTRDEISSFCCFCSTSSEIATVSSPEEIERPPFDINLAVVLAGFAFEAYTSPPENFGKREMDAANCQTVFLSESFLREIYDGQLFIKLKKGFHFPAMVPWGTSDPYVVMQLDSQVVKSKVKWGTKEPSWNEGFVLNIKQPPTKYLQVAAWDANLVTPHKRMGNAGVRLEGFCDGNMHEVLIDLEGMGGGGRIQLEVKYKSFEEIEDEKKWWRIPIVTEFLHRYGFDSALKMFGGSETVQASQFVQYAFGQLKMLNNEYIQDWFPSISKTEGDSQSITVSETDVVPQLKNMPEGKLNYSSNEEANNVPEDNLNYGGISSQMTQARVTSKSDKFFWKNFADIINQNVVQKFGIPAPQKIKWDGLDLLNKIGRQSQRIAEAGYIESGLATPEGEDVDKPDVQFSPLNISAIQSSFPDIKKATQTLLQQTDSILGAFMVLNASISQLNKEAHDGKKIDANEDASSGVEDVFGYSADGSVLDERKAEEMRVLFSTAESAMEAWAMLATSLGHPSFIKSEFEKLCFLDNSTTDTQVAIWRDSARKRLVVAFRGTEQARWKDLRTDLMLVPAGLNPERIGGDFKQEVQVHSGFLSAYDSVRTRILSLIKLAIGYIDDNPDPLSKWHVYVTGHSLGGALATLLALELSSSQLAKRGVIKLSMYNFGSPRVGNKKFAEVYNKKVKDSWRVVNHRDIIPSVPRLMGYCHVAQPIYLAAGNLQNALENIELLGDGYQGDIIGESTPDVLVNEFMKGEKELIQNILNTEINIFRSIRDGSALMQHMEDFYYITLLENVRSNYQTLARSQNNTKSIPVG